VDEVHNKLGSWLCTSYLAVLPKFETQTMVRRQHRKIHSKTARIILTRAHYRFRQRLFHKAELHSWCQIIVCDEAYTSKTCGACGTLNQKLGSNKTFKTLVRGERL